MANVFFLNFFLERFLHLCTELRTVSICTVAYKQEMYANPAEVPLYNSPSQVGYGLCAPLILRCPVCS